jgi:hypothetical protein
MPRIASMKLFCDLKGTTHHFELLNGTSISSALLVAGSAQSEVNAHG